MVRCFASLRVLKTAVSDFALLVVTSLLLSSSPLFSVVFRAPLAEVDNRLSRFSWRGCSSRKTHEDSRKEVWEFSPRLHFCPDNNSPCEITPSAGIEKVIIMQKRSQNFLLFFIIYQCCVKHIHSHLNQWIRVDLPRNGSHNSARFLDFRIGEKVCEMKRPFTSQPYNASIFPHANVCGPVVPLP